MKTNTVLIFSLVFFFGFQDLAIGQKLIEKPVFNSQITDVFRICFGNKNYEEYNESACGQQFIDFDIQATMDVNTGQPSGELEVFVYVANLTNQDFFLNYLLPEHVPPMYLRYDNGDGYKYSKRITLFKKYSETYPQSPFNNLFYSSVIIDTDLVSKVDCPDPLITLVDVELALVTMSEFPVESGGTATDGSTSSGSISTTTGGYPTLYPASSYCDDGEIFDQYFTEICNNGVPPIDILTVCVYCALYELSDEGEVDDRSIELEKQFSISPNPFNDEILYEFTANTEAKSKLLLFDVNGKLVIDKTISIKQGSNSFSLDTRNLLNGVYFSAVNINGERVITKLIK